MGGKSKARQIAEAEIREAVSVALGSISGRYLKAFDRRAHGYALLGHTNDEIAELIGIDPSTFDRWMVEHPSLARSVQKARHDDNVAIVKAMHRAARGYKHRETKLNVVDGQLVKTEVSKAYPPSVQAASLILMNRAGAQWKDTKTVQHSGRIDLAALVTGSMGDGAKVIEGDAIVRSPPTVEPNDEA